MAPATVEPPTVKAWKRPVPIPESKRNLCKLLYSQGVKVNLISQETGVKAMTIHVWANRFGWNKDLTTSRTALVNLRTPTLTVQTVANPALSRASTASRSDVSDVLAAQLAILKQNPPKSLAQLRNTPDGEGLVSVTKRLVDSLAVVHDWSAQRNQGVVVFEQSTLQDEPAIDVQASCGVEPTAGSVPPQQSIGDATTSSQPTDSK